MGTWRQVEELGIRAIDRGHCSCVHRTAGCAGCYVLKFARMYENTRNAWAKGGKDDLNWASMTPRDFARLPSGTRVRLCTRGEPLSTVSDVDRIATWAVAAPHVTLWIPTRGWRNPQIKARAEAVLFPLPNVRLLASVDRETVGCADSLAADGWSTMYFDPDNRAPKFSGLVVKCRKTWKHETAICGTCKGGCFAHGTPRMVWLKFHGSGPDAARIRAAAARVGCP